MFEDAAKGEPRNPLADWCSRGGVALLFVMAGLDKFDGHSMWPKFFQDVGIGQWFRYFTGIVEVLAALLVMVPRAAVAGLALLAVTMATAAGVWIFVFHQPGNALFVAIICAGLSAFAWSRRRADN